jgi:hypothetical protein
MLVDRYRLTRRITYGSVGASERFAINKETNMAPENPNRDPAIIVLKVWIVLCCLLLAAVLIVPRACRAGELEPVTQATPQPAFAAVRVVNVCRPAAEQRRSVVAHRSERGRGRERR